MVKELLLGDNPFIGVSHLSHEKARETQRELSVQKKIEVIEAAVEAGATGFTFSTHPANKELLLQIRHQRPDILSKLNYYILVPYAAGYVREATKTGLPGLIKKILLTSLNRDTIKLMLLPTPTKIINMFIDSELREYIRILPRSNIKAILLHEVLTELITAFNLDSAVKSLARHFEKRGVGFGLETRNILNTKEFLEKSNLTVEYIMTPMNPLGYQMTPSKEVAEKTILKLSDHGIKIIAINILASGAVRSIVEAVSYLEHFKDSIYAVAIGTSKTRRAYESFTLLRSLVN